MFQRALICTDFSDGLYRLVNFVPSLVAGGLKEIVFFHCAPLMEELEIPRIDIEGVEKARNALSVALKEVPAGVKVDVEVVSGRPIELILKTAQSRRSDVIVTGMPTRTLLTEKLFGSTTMGLSERTSVPLLILRPQLISAYTTEELDLRCRHLFRYFLITYNGSQKADSLVEQLKGCIRAHPDSALQRCLLLWVIGERGRRDFQVRPSLEDAQTRLAVVKADLETLGLTVDIEAREGVPIEEILNLAEVYDISAIATCPGRTSGFIKWSVPSLTSDILRQSWHPVIFFPV